ncbi:MmcQ/YjbR family DNA-binding protein [Mycolicibacillus trivialis]|uniref:MmcQ/YjbR family DNA-binding protein n=1 Tax=Mycolicibacillus trivialis TaxID=1798 RepID=A0A1X2ER45_9MYCO|nr:MmcQ/YjbR family DNA-binding protein [Mycolicibacillus trivialis]ORX08546.1 hypothetical protein AWC30_01690 [Mycolicibacillus trivialis]
MVTETVTRQLALALPEVIEQDHHGFPSFRVARRIFATLPSADLLRVMLDEHGTRSAAATWPQSCREFYWGKRLACLEIDLPHADEALVRTLLAEAWDHKNPGRRKSASR